MIRHNRLKIIMTSHYIVSEIHRGSGDTEPESSTESSTEYDRNQVMSQQI